MKFIPDHQETNSVISVALITLCTLFLLYGCGERQEKSTNIPISNIAPDFRFFADNNGTTRVEALIQKDHINSDIYINLENGDTLWATTGGDIASTYFNNNLFQNLTNISENYILLSETYSKNIFSSAKIWYQGRFNTDDTHTIFRIQLLRVGKPQAATSTVSLSPNFSITAPLANDSFSRFNDAIVVNWIPDTITNSVIVKFETHCSGSYDNNKVETELNGDPGSYTLPANRLSQRVENNCSTTVFVIKTRLGTLDPSFNVGGRIIAYQTRTVTVNTRN